MPKKKIIVIEGETGAGKDCVTNHISEKFNIPKLVSYATRPKRESERDGVEHYFISKEKMKEIKENDVMLAYTKIEDKSKTNAEGFEYGTTLSQLTSDTTLYIIDPDGVNNMKKNAKIMENIELLIMHIYVPLETRRARVMQSRSNIEAFEKRVLNEQAQFERARQNHEYDYLIENNELEDTYNKVDEIVEKFLARNCSGDY